MSEDNISLSKAELDELIDDVKAAGGGFKEYWEAAEAIEQLRIDLNRQPVEGGA